MDIKSITVKCFNSIPLDIKNALFGLAEKLSAEVAQMSCAEIQNVCSATWNAQRKIMTTIRPGRTMVNDFYQGSFSHLRMQGWIVFCQTTTVQYCPRLDLVLCREGRGYTMTVHSLNSVSVFQSPLASEGLKICPDSCSMWAMSSERLIAEKLSDLMAFLGF